MILISIVNNYVLNNQKCIRPVISTYLRTKQFFYQQYRTATSKPKNNLIIKALSQKLCCDENIAADIHKEFPKLRQINAIKNDTLMFLRSHLSAQSILENPLLITIDIESLKNKINMLNAIQPKSLDDFASFLTLNEIELKELVAGFAKHNYEHAIHGHTNRIYYLSERLQVEPKLIARSIANCSYNMTCIKFRNFDKKVRILLDYGLNPKELANNLYAFNYSTEMLMRRFECLLATGVPVKVWYLTLSQENFDKRIEEFKLKKAENEIDLSDEMMIKIRKLNTTKQAIIESLMSLLGGDYFESSQLYYSYVNDLNELEMAQNNINHLLKLKINQETIRKNGFLLIMTIDEIDEKINIMQQMKPNNIADFIPLLIADTVELEKYRRNLVKLKAIGNDHPIYYFSAKLEIPVAEVAAYFGTKSTVFLNIMPNTLKSKLDVLLKHDVDRTTILSNSWVFKTCSAAKIEYRIICLKKYSLDKISASMIPRVHSTNFQLQIERHLEEKKSLDGFENGMDYLSNRLGWSENDLKDALTRLPNLKNSSASKIKTHLDFLQNEVGLTVNEIQKSLYIIKKNLDEMKLRVYEMKKNGLPIKLGIISLSKNSYLEYMRSYCKSMENFYLIEARIKFKK